MKKKRNWKLLIFGATVLLLMQSCVVVRKARQNGERRIRIEHIGRIEIGHALILLGKRGHIPIEIDPEHIAHIDRLVRRVEYGRGAAVGEDVGDIGHGWLVYRALGALLLRCV